MTSDEELDKLAIDWEAQDYEGFRDAWQFIAGFRMAEKLMAERWPSEAEYMQSGGTRHTYNWLKQKLFGEENDS
jgi:hypothetical protein